jgi:hypothetical protein
VNYEVYHDPMCEFEFNLNKHKYEEKKSTYLHLVSCILRENKAFPHELTALLRLNYGSDKDLELVKLFGLTRTEIHQVMRCQLKYGILDSNFKDFALRVS